MIHQDETATVMKGERGGYIRTMKPGGSIRVGPEIIITVLDVSREAARNNGSDGDECFKKGRGEKLTRLLFSGLPEGMLVTSCDSEGQPVSETALPPGGENVDDHIRTVKPGGAVMIGDSILVTVLARTANGNGQEKGDRSGHTNTRRRRKRGGNRVRLLFSGLPEGMLVTECKESRQPVFETELPSDGNTADEDGQSSHHSSQQERRVKPPYAHRGPMQRLLTMRSQ